MPSFANPLPYRPDRRYWSGSFYYRRVDDLPVDPAAPSIMAGLLADNAPEPWLHLTPFGADNWSVSCDSGRAAASYFVDSWPTGRTPTRVNWSIVRPDRSTPNPHLYWSGLRQQDALRATPLQRLFGASDYQPSLTYGDRHAVLWSEATGELVEAIGYIGNAAKTEAIVTYRLGTIDGPLYALPSGSTGKPAGVCAASIPIAPLLFTYRDLLNCGDTGHLGHMVGLSLRTYGPGWRWPARSADGLNTGSPVQAGTVFRLRPEFPVGSLPPGPLQALARTLQVHGGIVYDRNLGVPKVTTISDPDWPQGTADLGVVLADRLPLSELEPVDLSPVAGPVNTIAVKG
jgi:hypothetical protein